MSTGKHAVAPRQDDPPYRKGEPAALFIPCYVDQFYPEIGAATAQLLARYGVPVVFPSEQTCCGQPAFNSGYWEEARRVIRHFCEVFASHRWIVCPSASCTAMCRVFFGHVDADPRIVGVGRRVFELTEFLVDILKVTDTGATFPHKVALHVGCHGRRELGMADPPRQLLQNVRGLTCCELPNVEECCGFGGTFSVKMPGTSLAMGGTKVENILKSGAEVVVSADVSCLMHIGGILRRSPDTRHVRTMHISQVLVAGTQSQTQGAARE
ncbi:MAG: (Fe-S)-binding protein [Thermoguttaceae bacterium]|jgi:L-lactate dehydrogenase complex protein LldE